MNLLNKEEASRPHTLAWHFLPRPSEFLLPTELLLTPLTGTYFANPLSPDKIISASQISWRPREEIGLQLHGKYAHSNGDTGTDSCRPRVSQSLLSEMLSYPAMVTPSRRKPPLFATLSSHQTQYFSFPDSIWLISLLSCGRNSSFQPEGDTPSSETKLH